MSDDMFLTSSQVAQKLGISSETVRRWTRAGLLKCQFTRGRHRRFRLSDVEGLLKTLGADSPERSAVPSGAPGEK